MQFRKNWAAVGVAVAAIALAGAGVARGEEGGEPSKPPAAGSVSLHDRTIDVTEALAANYDRDGFANVEVDADRHVVTIRWAGEIPDDIKRQAGNHDGVQVEVIPARYSEKVLVSVARKIMATNHDFAPEQVDGSDQTVPGIRSVGPTNDQAGLVIRLGRDAYELRESISYDALTDSEKSIPRTYEIDSAPAAVGDLSRPNDSAPWQAGGAINKGGVHNCSTGFAVLTGGGNGRLLSAGHCEDVGATANDGAGDVIGQVVREKYNFDSILIDPTVPSGVFATIGKVFTGGWSSNSSKFVGGASAPSLYEPVCTSGANSGEHCDLRVVALSQVEYCDGGLGVCTGFYANGPGLNLAVGDSGGPVYVERNDQRVGARGIINKKYGSTVTCSGIRYNGTGVACYTGVFSVGIHNLLSEWQVTIET